LPALTFGRLDFVLRVVAALNPEVAPGWLDEVED